eukprot:gene8286-9136_t
MGGYFSSSGDSSNEKRGTTVAKASFYAELLSDKGLPSDLPPIKVLINDQLATTAVDQLRDSQVAAHELAKNLVIDMLRDKDSPKKLGTLLQYVFKYESLLQPTRDLLYWSLRLPTTYSPIYSQLKYTFNYAESAQQEQLAALSKSWLLDPQTKREIIIPLFKWNLEDEETTIKPLASLLGEVVPTYKAEVRAAVKDGLLEYLRSDEARHVVRDGIVRYLSKDDPSSTPAE